MEVLIRSDYHKAANLIAAVAVLVGHVALPATLSGLGRVPYRDPGCRTSCETMSTQ